MTDGDAAGSPDEEQGDPSPTALRIVWTEWTDTVCELSEIEQLSAWQREVGAVIEEIRTDLPINGELLSALVPLVTGEEFEPRLNGHMMEPHILASDGWALIPESPDDLFATELACADAAWLPGGPCEFTQAESIWALDEFHWVEARGDMENLIIAIGDLGDPEVSLAAAVAASRWFSFDENDEIVSELDEIPDPYEEDENESEAEREERSDRSSPSGLDGSTPQAARATTPCGVLRCVARFNILDPLMFAHRVELLLSPTSGIIRRDRGEPTDRFESGDGRSWSALDPAAVLMLAIESMPTRGTELEGWSPRVRAGELSGWPTVYEIVITLDEFPLHDLKLRAKWLPKQPWERWQPPTLGRRLQTISAATLLTLELWASVTP